MIKEECIDSESQSPEEHQPVGRQKASPRSAARVQERKTSKQQSHIIVHVSGPIKHIYILFALHKK